MKLRRINVNQVNIPEVRVTAVYDDETRDLLRDSLKAMGTVQPIIVVATGDNFEIVDGMHRLQEARDRGDQQIDAVVYEGDSKDTLLMNLVLNKVRGKTKASEMVTVIGTLYTEYHMDPDQIQEKTGLPRDYIEKLIAISKASPSVQDALDMEVIGVGHAYQLSRLPYPVQQDEILAKYQVYRFTVKDLKEQIDAVLVEMGKMKQEAATPGLVIPAAPRHYYCEGCHGETEPRYLRPVMLCPDCFGAVWRLAKSAAPAQEEKGDETGGG